MSEPQTPKPKVADLGQIRADRACIRCGFNMFGQTVTKEEHYGLAIARCPECGEVAAIQSYPTMSHWVNRFRMLLTALWVAVLIALFIGNTMAFMGLTLGASNLASEKMGDRLGYSYHQWQEEKKAAEEAASTANPSTTPTQPTIASGTTVTTITNGVTIVNGVVQSPGGSYSPGQYRWTSIESQWYEDHVDQAVQDNGGAWANLDRQFLVLLVPGGIVSMAAGIFWSIALLGANRRRVIVIPVITCSIAMAIVYVVSIPDSSWMTISEVSQGLYTPLIGPVFLAYMFTVSAIGIWCGRKVARVVILLTLPPRSRTSVSILWTRDGLELPKPKTV